MSSGLPLKELLTAKAAKIVKHRFSESIRVGVRFSDDIEEGSPLGGKARPAGFPDVPFAETRKKA